MTKNLPQTIISTASVEGSLSLVQQLAEHGMQVYTFPMIVVEPISDIQQIREYLSAVSEYQWIIFTSKFGVTYFFESLFQFANSYNLPVHIRIACVGQKTADVVTQYNHTCAFVSPNNNGNDFASELHQIFSDTPTRVLFPTGNLTQNMIPLRMPNHIRIDKIIVYNTVPPASYNLKILDRIIHNQYDFIVFSSPSGATNFMSFFKDLLPISSLRTVSIGPSTTERLQSFGVESIVQAAIYNYPGIVTAIINCNKAL